MNALPSTDELLELDVIDEGYTCDLHYDDGVVRLFVARTSSEDGEPFDNTVYVEQLTNGRWADLGYYDGDYPPNEIAHIRGDDIHLPIMRRIWS